MLEGRARSGRSQGLTHEIASINRQEGLSSIILVMLGLSNKAVTRFVDTVAVKACYLWDPRDEGEDSRVEGN